MRLTHIFLALLILAAMIVLPLVLFLDKGKLSGGPGILATFLVFWWLIDAITPVALTVAWIKKRPIRHQFSFTLLAFLNLYFGLMGVLYFVRQRNILEYKTSFLVFLLNLTWSAVIAYVQLRKYGTEQQGP
jgi:hypothetical protein